MPTLNLLHPDENKGTSPVRSQETLENMLLKGLTSPASELTEKDWSEIRQEAMVALAARHKMG